MVSVSNSQRGRSCEQICDSSTTFLNPLVGGNSLYGKRTVGFFSLAKRDLWACKARTLRARKTLTPRFTNFFNDFEKKTDCFAVYRKQEINSKSPHLLNKQRAMKPFNQIFWKRCASPPSKYSSRAIIGCISSQFRRPEFQCYLEGMFPYYACIYT